MFSGFGRPGNNGMYSGAPRTGGGFTNGLPRVGGPRLGGGLPPYYNPAERNINGGGYNPPAPTGPYSGSGGITPNGSGMYSPIAPLPGGGSPVGGGMYSPVSPVNGGGGLPNYMGGNAGPGAGGGMSTQPMPYGGGMSTQPMPYGNGISTQPMPNGLPPGATLGAPPAMGNPNQWNPINPTLPGPNGGIASPMAPLPSGPLGWFGR